MPVQFNPRVFPEAFEAIDALWTRLRNEAGGDSSYANDMHWGFTFLGLVAAEQGQLLDAGEQLRRFAKVWAEYRLSSYGPSCLLARKLCEAGMWKDVEEYLVAWEASGTTTS